MLQLPDFWCIPRDEQWLWWTYCLSKVTASDKLCWDTETGGGLCVNFNKNTSKDIFSLFMSKQNLTYIITGHCAKKLGCRSKNVLWILSLKGIFQKSQNNIQVVLNKNLLTEIWGL